MIDHVPYVKDDPLLGAFTAGCICGWVGQQEKSKLTAMTHWITHWLEVTE